MFKITKKQDQLQLINIITGEALSKESSNEDISEALKVCIIERNRLVQIEKDLKKIIQERISPEDKKFAEFWDLIQTYSTSIDVKNMTEEHLHIFNKIKKKYTIKTPRIDIKFPKYI